MAQVAPWWPPPRVTSQPDSYSTQNKNKPKTKQNKTNLKARQREKPPPTPSTASKQSSVLTPSLHPCADECVYIPWPRAPAFLRSLGRGPTRSRVLRPVCCRVPPRGPCLLLAKARAMGTPGQVPSSLLVGFKGLRQTLNALSTVSGR